MGISEAVVKAAIEDIFDIMDEGKYLLRLGKLMNAIRTLVEYFGDQIDSGYGASSNPVTADQALAVLDSLNDKVKYALETKEIPSGGFAYAQADPSAIDPATILVIINVAIQLIKLWKQLRG